MAFFVGQKVTPVDSGEWDDGEPHEIVPQYSVVYTVRDIDFFDGEDVIRLMEIRNRPDDYLEGRGEVWFVAAEFRPVTDISDLSAIVREAQSGTPRQIAADQFDRKVRT